MPIYQFYQMQKSKTEKQSILALSKTHSKAITDRKRTLSSSEYANVNSYKHFLAIPSANQSYIQWAIGLRSNQQVKAINNSAVPPQTYYKTIQSRKTKHTSADISQNVNISEFEHLALHRIGPPPSCDQLRFETTLRPHSLQKNLFEKQRKWCTIPKIDRNQEPTFIKSKSLKKKIIQPEELERGIDGLHQYPKFTQKIIKSRNCNQFRHMIKGRVNLPSISWQVNLRSY